MIDKFEQINQNKIRKAIVKEVNSHIERKHWEMIPREHVPKVYQFLPVFCSFKNK